jgi:release factor glutamine methyltransferase
MRLLDAIRESSEYLEKSGIEDPFEDAELLVLHAAATDRLTAFLENPETGKDLLRMIRRLLRRRAKGEPLQYIIGHVDFLGLTITVGRGVLIPRPETELLAQEAIRIVQGSGSKVPLPKDVEHRTLNITHGPYRILDLCTGSGCVALALARELPDARVYGSDVSKTAIRLARTNAELNNIGNVTFLTGSLFGPVRHAAPFDMIVSNPPYIKTGEICGLQREIRDWEPRKALDGGEEGLDFYRRIFSGAGGLLKQQGIVVVELGFGQAAGVTEIAKASGFRTIQVIKDYAGIERILRAEE